MRKHLTILLLVVSTLCYGQDYKKCTIYRYTNKDTSSITRQIFNKHGKIAYEEKQYELNYTQKKTDRTYYYYIMDTLLSQSISYETPAFYNYDLDSLNKYGENAKEIIEANTIDTTLIIYNYNTLHQLTKKVIAYYSYDQAGCDMLTSRGWQDTTTITYLYDKQNRLTEENVSGYHGMGYPVNKTVYSYDNQNRIRSINNYSVHPLNPDTPILVSSKKHIYNKSGYTVIEYTPKLPINFHEETDTTERHIFNYNKGKLETETRVSKYGTTTFYYSYHPTQRLDKEEYKSDGVIKETTIYIYE